MQGAPRERREGARLGEANFVLTTLHNSILAKSNPFAEKDEKVSKGN